MEDIEGKDVMISLDPREMIDGCLLGNKFTEKSKEPLKHFPAFPTRSADLPERVRKAMPPAPLFLLPSA